MRSLSRILPVSLLLLASGAGAQTDYYLSTQSGATTRVQVVAQAQPFQFRDAQAEWISGAYAMSNGIVARIDKRHPALLADVSQGIGAAAQINGRPIRLTAVSPDRYVTADGNISMEFNRGAQGDGMLMSYVPDAGTGQVVVVSSTAAALAQP